MAQTLVQEHGYLVRPVCALLELAPSSYYYRNQTTDLALERDLKQEAGQHPTYGTRRLMHQLRRSPYRYQVNRKRIQRLARCFGLLRPVKRRKIRTTDSQHPYPRYENLVKGLKVVRPDEVWVSDITYIHLKNDFVYLAIVLDVFTRAVRGWCLSRTIDQQLTLDALLMALHEHKPQIHHSDQGVQYACSAYVEILQLVGVHISMAAVGKAEENGYAERFMRTIKEEEVDCSEYHDFAEANRQIGAFIQDVYMTKRIHSALGYLTPTEFEASYWLSSKPAWTKGHSLLNP
jgi:transposase InsO family protein